MLLTKTALTSGAVLAGSLKMAAAFFGCCDDPPPAAPANQTITKEVINPGDVAGKLQPEHKFIYVHGNAKYGAEAGAGLDLEGAEIAGKVEVEAGGTFIYIGKLKALRSKFRSIPENDGPGGPAPSVSPWIGPRPKNQYLQWHSPTVSSVVMTDQTIQTIEGDTQPLRFAFSFPFDGLAEFLASGVEAFWVEALDPSGNNVLPAGAKLVSTPQSEWPILSSTIVWPLSELPVLSIALDVVDGNGLNVMPSDIGCDQHPVTFRIGFSTSDLDADFDFGYAASLWRTETDYGHIGDGGLWLGWHAASLNGDAMLNDPPEILQLADLGGNPITTVSAGDIVEMKVLNGFPQSEVETSVGYQTLPILATAPGRNPGETLYYVQIPAGVTPGPSDFFFRNLGATPMTYPNFVPDYGAGFDYARVTVQ